MKRWPIFVSLMFVGAGGACRKGTAPLRDAVVVSRPIGVTAGGDGGRDGGGPQIVIAAESEPEPDAGQPDVRLTVRIMPVDAEIHWGAKRLGVARRGERFEIVRRRHSGPLDLVIRAPGFAPYHTRLFSDRDDSVAIELVRAAGGTKRSPR